MKARWLTMFAAVPLVIGMVLLQSCGGVGGPNGTSTTGGVNTPTKDFLALLSPDQAKSQYIGPEACGAAACHGGAPHSAQGIHTASMPKTAGSNQYTMWKDTMHAQKGVSCENCHGPGGAHKANPTKDNILTFPKLTSPTVCGQCHGPTHDQYTASKHFGLLTVPIEETAAKPSVYKNSRCVVCHSGLVRSQYTEEGTDFGTLTDDQLTAVLEDTTNVVPHIASCVTCHDPHAKTGNVTWNGGKEVQLRHPEDNMDTSQIAPATTSATFTAFNQVCAECHNGRGANPADTALANGSRPNMHASDQYNTLLGVGAVEGTTAPPKRYSNHATAPGQCVHCHMPNSNHTFTVNLDNSCAPCHSTADAAARLSSMKSETLDALTALQTRMANWAQATFGDPTFWDYPANIAAGKTPPSASSIPIEIKRARHNYYFIVNSGDFGIHNPPYTRYIVQVANDNLNNLGIAAVDVKLLSAIPMNQKLQQVKAQRALAIRADMSAGALP